MDYVLSLILIIIVAIFVNNVVLAPGAFLALGYLIVLFNKITKKA